jgi:hypothetical protein
MKWCKHVGGFGPPFPFCEVCTKKSMTTNAYKVPKKQWKKWGEAGQSLFNSTYYTLLNNQGVMHHPKQKELPAEHWNTLAWNAARIAADALRDSNCATN